jgi:CDP-diacylglycerol--glycerol-3-phosphate 3-phosphatidyltransferase
MDHATKERPLTFTDFLRKRFHGLTTRAGNLGVRLGIDPDVVTVAGLGVVAIAAVFIGTGHFFWGGVILLIGLPLDAWDGAIARALNRKSRFGALLDSTLDRYADAFILLGVMYHFSVTGNHAAFLVSGAALIGAFLVSYVRARAEGLGIPCQDGWFSRVERSIVQWVMLLTGWVVLGVIILAIGNNLTALQRIYTVYQATRQDS